MEEDDLTLIQAGEDPNFGFSNLPTGVKGITGLGLIGASTAMMRGQTPGGVRRASADFASNRLEGFYKKGAWKTPRYAWELAKTGGRLGWSAAGNIVNSEFYNKTGVSPVVMRDLYDIDKTKNIAENKYLAKTKGYYKKSAINDMKFAEKKLYFKLSNDKANQLLFGGKSSPIIDKIIGDKVKLTNVDDFIKAANGDRALANYVMTRQPSIVSRGQTIDNIKGLQFIKYKPGKFGDVLRATQFDRGLYKTMLDLKNSGTINNALNIIPKKYNPKFINGKFVFSLSPMFKPDWDWGGFNSVAVWDPKNRTTRGKIRLMATDVPDVDIKGRPVPGSGGKYPAIKYVDSREITISEGSLKKEGIEIKKPVKTGRTNKPGGGRRAGDRYASDLKYNRIFSQEEIKELNKLKDTRKKFNLSKVKKLGKLGRRLPGAAGLALMAWDLVNYFKED